MTHPSDNAHRAAVSALVGDTRVYRDVRPEGSYLASSERIVHFGLGNETKCDLRVRWPGSPREETEAFGSFAAGQTAVLRRNGGASAGAERL